MNQTINYSLSAIALVMLAACGGGGGGVSALTPSTTTVGGLVAVGAALPNASVLLTDANGDFKTTTANASGEYSFDTTGMLAPFVVKAAGAIGTQEFNLVSVLASTTEGTSNAVQITPLTTAIAALVNSNNNYNADTLTPTSVSATSLAAATSTLTTALSAPIAAAGLPSTFNPVTHVFSADRTGADQVLDVVDVRIKPSGVVLANRMEVLSNTSDPTNMTLTASGPTGTWASGVIPAGPALLALENKLKSCFALPANQRASGSTTDTGGMISVDLSQIAPACKDFVKADYAHNTYNYGERWGSALSSTEFLNADVVVNLRYVLARPGTADGNVYVVNVNFKDINGNWYTRPEVLERTTTNTSDSFALYGNRRQVDFSIDANFTYIDDLATPTNSRVEGRLQLNSTPHRAKLANGTNHQYFYDANTPNLAQPKLICAWITGPMLQSGVAHDVSNPKGGVLVKIPHPDAVANRNFMPIHAKYSADFDPINNFTGATSHRRTLLNDCKSTTGTSIKIGTANTNNQFTFSAAKANSTATWAYPGPSGNNFVIDSSNVATCNGNTTTATDGCPRRSYVNIRSTEATAQDKQDYIDLFGNTSMPRFTIYAFQADDYLNAEPAGYSIWSNNLTTFWDSKIIETGRMIAPMAFVDRDANGTYSGDIKFRKPDAATVSTYMGATLTALAAGTNVNVSWTVPAGAQGVDRFGGKGQAYFVNNTGSERVIVSSIAQISKGSPRSVSSGVLTLSDEWLGNDAIGTNKTYAGTTFAVTSVYREIWARSYDLENRQIQYVYTRKN